MREFKGKIRISGTTEGTPQQCPNTVIYLDDFVFAKVYGKTKEECEANAKLIACAPVLLKYAIEFVKAVENEDIIIQENTDNDGLESTGSYLYESFLKAINKSTS